MLRKLLILQLLYAGSVCIHNFWIVESSILIAFVIMLENDEICKLLIYPNIYLFFFLCRHFAHTMYWGISNKNSKIIEVFILMCLLVTCPNKTSKVLTLKLTAVFIKAYQQYWYYQKCLIVSLRLFPTC